MTGRDFNPDAAGFDSREGRQSSGDLRAPLSGPPTTALDATFGALCRWLMLNGLEGHGTRIVPRDPRRKLHPYARPK